MSLFMKPAFDGWRLFGLSEKKPAALGSGLFPLGVGKKRGRKEFYGGKGADHGFRVLSVIRINWGFEQQMTQMKTKCVEIMNKGRKA